MGVYRKSLSSEKDFHGRSWMVIRNPEKRKVGGSIPPLTTTSDQAERLGELVGPARLTATVTATTASIDGFNSSSGYVSASPSLASA